MLSAPAVGKPSSSHAAGMLRVLGSPLVITLVALVLRLALAGHFVAWMTANGKGDPYIGNEPTHIAAHIARGEGFSSPYDDVPLRPSAQQPPLYPLLVAGLFKITGPLTRASLWVLVGINCLLGSLVCWLIWRVAARWFSPLAGVIAAWLWALLPPVGATDLNLSHYVLSTIFVLGWLCLLPREPRMGGKKALFLGALLGLGMLMNSMLALLFPASARWFLNAKRQALLLLLAGALVVSPWLLRNYVVMGHFYPGLRDSFGQALYVGNHRGMRYVRGCAWNLCGGTFDYSDAGDDIAQFAARGEDGFMNWKLTQAVAYIRSSPLQYLARSAKRAAAFWLLPYPWFYLLMALLAWGGSLRPIGLRFFLITLFALYPLAYYFTEAVWATSYRHPIEPLIMISAASAAVALLERRFPGIRELQDGVFAGSKQLREA